MPDLKMVETNNFQRIFLIVPWISIWAEWENLSANVQMLKKAGYVQVKKSLVDDRPQTWVRLTRDGREAYRTYRAQMKGVLDDLPD